MKLNDMFPRRYATGNDLNGKAVTLTISQTQAERMRPNPHAPEQIKYVVYFSEATKGVILCRTLARQISDIVGSEETDDWVGKQITLCPQPMTVAGQARVAIRARKAQAANGEAPPPPTLQDEEEI